MILVFLACQCWLTPAIGAEKTRASTSQKRMDLPTRNNAFALLDELLNDEKHLSKILILKSESAELDRLVKTISRTAAEGQKMLDSIASHDASLKHAEAGLPPGERAVRKAIERTTRNLFLHSKGPEFEFQLLLSQAEALNYGTHLISVFAENDSERDRVEKLLELSTRLKQLREQVLGLLRNR